MLLSCDRAAAQSHADTLLAKKNVLQQRVDQFAQWQSSRDRFREQIDLIATKARFAEVKETALDLVLAFVR